MYEKTKLIGAITAIIIFASSIVTFLARIFFASQPGNWIGLPILLMAFPLAYLLIKAPAQNQPVIYYIQVGLMLLWIICLFLLDYIFKVDFRQTQWMVITFVVFYFAGMGGMIGIAARAGRGWTISAVILFFVAGILAFVQRAVTGF